MPKPKTPATLTVTKATSQARRHVDRLMPGVLATVETRGSANPKTLEHLMVTTVTFPEGHPNAAALYGALSELPNRHGNMTIDSARIVIKRKV
jgi:hypothetical protein